MSRIIYKTLSLEQVISKSDYILSVEIPESHFAVEEIDVTPWKYKMIGRKLKPYKTLVAQFIVLEELLNRTNRQLTGTINVCEPRLRSKIDTYRKHALLGLRKSVIAERLEPRVDIDEGHQAIIFVKNLPERYEFVCKNAYVPSSFESEVMTILNSRS